MEKKSEGEWKKSIAFSFIILILVLLYAIVRYNIFKGVEFIHLPLYLSNKAIAVASVILIGISYILGPLAKFWPEKFVQKLYLRKHLGLLGFGFAAVHGIISLLLFNSSYYPKFFTEAGKLTLEGELSMLFGILSLFIFSIVAVTSLPSFDKILGPKNWLIIQRLGYLAFILVLGHVFVMGIAGWLKPQDWPGSLLPMSLIAFIVIMVVLITKLIVIALPKKEEIEK